jgi:tetratricopeptide (TPR) repeat protein
MTGHGSEHLQAYRQHYLNEFDQLLIVRCQSEGKFEDAIRHARQLLPHRTDRYSRYDLYRAIGMCSHALDKYDDSLAAYAEALALLPDDSDVLNWRAQLWLERKEYDKALADAEAAIRSAPENAEAYATRGDVFAQLNQGIKALSDFDKAIELNPKDASIRDSRAFYLHGIGEYDKAIADYDASIAIRPDDADTYYNRSGAYGRKGELEKAVADLNEVIRREPKYLDGAAYADRAELYDRLGKPDLALADMERLVQSAPENPWVYYRRASHRLNTETPQIRDPKKALADAKRACELSEWKDASYVSWFAAAYAEAGNKDEAVKWQTKAIELAEEDQRAYLQSLLELFKAGKTLRDEPKPPMPPEP